MSFKILLSNRADSILISLCCLSNMYTYMCTLKRLRIQTTRCHAHKNTYTHEFAGEIEKNQLSKSKGTQKWSITRSNRNESVKRIHNNQNTNFLTFQLSPFFVNFIFSVPAAAYAWSSNKSVKLKINPTSDPLLHIHDSSHRKKISIERLKETACRYIQAARDQNTTENYLKTINWSTTAGPIEYNVDEIFGKFLRKLPFHVVNFRFECIFPYQCVFAHSFCDSFTLNRIFGLNRKAK